MSIYVEIPEPTRSYSLYADGVLEEVVRLDRKTLVSLDDGYPMSLFYKLRGHRHLYVCAAQGLLPGIPARKFCGVRVPLAVVSELTGRGFDRYKRSLWRIRKSFGDGIMRLPPSFFWQLSAQCAAGRNSIENINALVLKYLRTRDGRLPQGVPAEGGRPE